MKKELSPIEKQLKIINFSDNEISAYLALLELGRGTVSQISRKALLNRTTGYDVLDRLVAKGIARISGKESKQEYAAESPDQLEKIIGQELKKKQEEIDSVRNIIPELRSMHNVTDRPKVRYYEGINEIKKALEDTLLKENTEILASGGAEDMFMVVGEEYSREYFKRRVEKNIKIRGIASGDPGTMKVVEKNKEELREILIVPDEKFHFSVETNIYNDKVLSISWKEKFAVLVESKNIADAQKKVFELAWAEAKRLDKELEGK